MITPIEGNGAGPRNGTLYTHSTLFVPITQQDGSPQPPERLAWLERELVKHAGGLTQYFPGQGLWMPPMNTTICCDEIIPFHVVTANSLETENWLIELMVEIALVFKQDQIFVFSQPVWLLDYSELTMQLPAFTAY